MAGQGRGQEAPLLLVVGVGLREPAVLDSLSHLGDRHGLIAVDLGQGVIERVGRMDGVKDLFLGAPPLARALLEQPERVEVPELEVDQLGLHDRRGVGDRGGARRQAAFEGQRGDRCRVGALLGGERDAVSQRRRST